MSKTHTINDTIGLLNELEQRTVKTRDLEDDILDMAVYEWWTFDKALSLQYVLTGDAKHENGRLGWCWGLAWDMHMADDLINEYRQEGEEWAIRKTTIRGYLERIEHHAKARG